MQESSVHETVAKSVNTIMKQLRLITLLFLFTLTAFGQKADTFVVGATRFGRGFRYSFRLGSKDHVQVDGRSVHRRVLLPARDFRAVADPDDVIRRTNQRRAVQFASSVSVESSGRV